MRLLVASFLGAILLAAPSAEAGVFDGTSAGVPSPLETLLAASATDSPRQAETDAEGASGMSPRVKAMLLSLLVPGLGQYSAGDRTWSYVFFGAEVAIWGTYVAFHIQGDAREERFQEFAGLWGGVASPKGHDDTYYTNVGRWRSYDDYQVALSDAEMYPADQHWLWPTDERRNRYLDLRAAAEDSFHRANFVLAAALVNRALAVVHAARSVSAESASFSLDVREAPGAELVPYLAWRTRF